MRIELLTEFYGQDHLEMFFDTLVPSLWKPDNLPTMLLGGHEVVHRIFCPPKEAEYLSLYSVCSEIAVEVDTAGFSEDHHDSLAGPFRQQVERGVLTVMAPCDHVFGNGLWRAIQNLQPGEYMVCGHPRIDFEKGFRPMREFLRGEPDLDNHKLVNFCLDQIPHPMVRHGKRSREGYWHCYRRGDHWEAHSAEPPPLAFWGTPDMLNPWNEPILFGPWEVIDHELVGWTFDRKRLRWIDNSHVFFWAEFTSNTMYTPTLYSSFKYGCMRHFRELPLRWYV